VKLWRLRQVGRDSAHPDYRFRSPSDLLNELEHNSAVLCLDFDKYANPLFWLITSRSLFITDFLLAVRTRVN
jgi:hypothetical protein